VVGSVTDTSIPLNWGRIGLLFGAGVVISVLASLWPARQSVKMAMLDAMAER